MDGFSIETRASVGLVTRAGPPVHLRDVPSDGYEVSPEAQKDVVQLWMESGTYIQVRCHSMK